MYTYCYWLYIHPFYALKQVLNRYLLSYTLPTINKCIDETTILFIKTQNNFALNTLHGWYTYRRKITHFVEVHLIKLRYFTKASFHHTWSWCHVCVCVCILQYISDLITRICHAGLDFGLAPSQPKTSLQSKAVSHWLGANLARTSPVLSLYDRQPEVVKYGWWNTYASNKYLPWTRCDNF